MHPPTVIIDHVERYSDCVSAPHSTNDRVLGPDTPHCVPVLPDDDQSDRALVARAQHDHEAFGVLYDRYVHRVRAFVVRRCGDVHLADDITASVFERAWRNIASVDVPEPGLAPWLYRIAANEVTNQFRKSGRGRRAQERLERVPMPDAPDPADAVLLSAEQAAVRRALDRLSPRHQEVIGLRYLAGLSPQETAEAMGISPPVVAAVLHRALRALERIVNQDTGTNRKPSTESSPKEVPK